MRVLDMMSVVSLSLLALVKPSSLSSSASISPPMTSSSPTRLSSTTSSSHPIATLKYTVVVNSAQELIEQQHSSNVTIVYFFHQDSQMVPVSLEDYEMSAKLLRIHNITLVLYDCDSDKSSDLACRHDSSETQVTAYLNGEVQDVFQDSNKTLDISTIMAHALTLKLSSHLVYITKQKSVYLKDFQKKVKGHRNVLYGYVRDFGNLGHRIFLEVAAKFYDRVQFALTIRDNAPAEYFPAMGIWAVYSAECLSDEELEFCPSKFYQGEESVAALSTFVKNMLEKTVYHVPADGLQDVLQMPDTLPLVFLYLNNATRALGVQVAVQVQNKLRDSAKIVLVHMEEPGCQVLTQLPEIPQELPALRVKKNGTLKLIPTKEWSVNVLLETIQAQVLEGKSLDEIISLIPNKDSIEFQPDYFIDYVLVPDDEVAIDALTHKVTDRELAWVPAFLKREFYEMIGQHQLKVVLFYSIFDHVSLYFLRTFCRSAEILAKNLLETDVLVRVNCFDATDLCTAENITTYPHIKIYQQGKSMDYRGPYEEKSLIAAVKLLRLNGPVQLTSNSEVEDFAKGLYPQPFYNYTSVSVLLLADLPNSEEEQIFIKAAKSLSSITAFGFCHGDLSQRIAMKFQVTVPALLAYNRNDNIEPVRVLRTSMSEEAISIFVKDSLIETVPELTVFTLPTLLAREQPLAILFVDSDESTTLETLAAFRELATSRSVADLIFCWMNAGDKTLGQKILEEYTWSNTLPVISVLDRKMAAVFNYQANSIVPESVSKWLDQVLEGKLSPSKMLTYHNWEPVGPYYDFLAKMDEPDPLELIELLKGQINEKNKQQVTADLPGQQGDKVELARDEVDRSQVKQDEVDRSQVKNDEVDRSQMEQNDVKRSQMEQDEVERSQMEHDEVERSQIKQDGIERSQMEKDEVERSQMKQDGVERSQIEHDEVERSQLEKDEAERSQMEHDQMEESYLFQQKTKNEASQEMDTNQQLDQVILTQSHEEL